MILKTKFYSIIWVILIFKLSLSENFNNSDSLFSLKEIITSAIESNSYEVNLIKIEYKLSQLSYNSSRSNRFEYGVATNFQIEKEFDELDSNYIVERSASAKSDAEATLKLFTGGDLKTSLSLPYIHSSIIPGKFDPKVNIILSQPVGIGAIKRNNILSRIEKEIPRKNKIIKKKALETYILQIISTYFNLITKSDQLIRSKEAEKAAEEDVEIAKMQYKAGDISKSDILALKSVQSDATLDVLRLEIEEMEERKKLLELIGEEIPVHHILEKFDFNQLKLPQKDSLIINVLNEDVNLTDLKLQMKLLETESKTISLFYPTIDGAFEYSPLKIANNFQSYTAALGITVPIVPHTQNRVTIRKKKLEYQKIKIQIDQYEQTIVNTVSKLYQSVIDQQNMLSHSQKSVADALAAYEGAREEYNNGDLSHISLDEYRKRMENSKRQMENATISILNDYFLVYQNQGTLLKFWGIDEERF